MKGKVMNLKILFITAALAASSFAAVPSSNRGDNYTAIGHITLGPSVTGFVDVAYSDAADIDFTGLNVPLAPRGFAVFTSGTLKITTVSGKTDAFADGELVVGAVYPEAIRKVWSTGTTVTLVRIYF